MYPGRINLPLQSIRRAPFGTSNVNSSPNPTTRLLLEPCTYFTVMTTKVETSLKIFRAQSRPSLLVRRQSSGRFFREYDESLLERLLWPRRSTAIPVKQPV